MNGVTKKNKDKHWLKQNDKLKDNSINDKMGHTFDSSLLLQLHWHIGGSPPVMHNRKDLWQRTSQHNDKKILYV